MVGLIQHEEVPQGRLPWVVMAVAAAWLALFILGSVLGPDRVLGPLGLVPARWTPLAMLGHPLVHANGVHLLGSLLLLALLGPSLEARLGPARMASLVALAGPLTGGFYTFMTPASSLALVGPSGLLAALLGASLAPSVWQPFRLIAYAPSRGRVLAHWLEVPAYTLPPLWLGCEILVSGLGDFASATKGVSGWGPVAGLAVGAGFVLALRIPAAGRRVAQQGSEGAAKAHPAVEEALIARDQGHHEHALAVLAEAAREHPDARDVVSAWWEMASLAGRPSEAAAAFQKLIRKELAEGDFESAAWHWCELSQRVVDLKPEPRFLIQLAPHIAAIGEKREAARALRMVMASDAGKLTSGIALRVAELARELHAPTALLAARHVLATDGLDATKRAKLAGLVVELGKRASSQPQLDLDAAPSLEAPPDRSIEIEPDDLGIGTLLDGAGSATGAAAAQDPLELSADGSLVSGDFDGDLSAGELVEVDRSTEASQGSSPERAESAAPVTADRSTDATDAIALATAASTPRFHEAKIVDAVPVSIGETRIELAQMSSGDRRGGGERHHDQAGAGDRPAGELERGGRRAAAHPAGSQRHVRRPDPRPRCVESRRGVPILSGAAALPLERRAPPRLRRRPRPALPGLRESDDVRARSAPDRSLSCGRVRRAPYSGRTASVSTEGRIRPAGTRNTWRWASMRNPAASTWRRIRERVGQ
jgi:membrane associated rhomboid family serine protease